MPPLTPPLALPRQRRCAHERPVDRGGALAPLADRPDDQRLAAPHVPAREHLFARRSVFDRVGGDIAAAVELNAKLRQKPLSDRRDETHRQEHQFRSQHEVGPLDRLELLVDPRALEARDRAVLALESHRRHRELALGAFLVARRGSELHGPVRPGEELVLMLGRHGQNFELRHFERALADRGADAVGARVAAADDDDVLAAGEDRFVRADRLARDAPVLLRQKLHREMYAREIAPGRGQIARGLGAAGKRDRVVGLDKALAAQRDADIGVRVECAAFARQLLDAPLDDPLLELEVGDAVAQKAAGPGVFLVDVNLVAGAGELLRAGEARRARAHNRDLLAGPPRGLLGLDPALAEGAVGDRAFDRLDRDRRLLEVERAGGLARGGADAAGDLREIVGRVEVARGLPPVAAIDEIVPVGDLVVDRAAGVTIGDAAVHAARRLPARRLFAQRNDELAVVADAVGGRR